MVRRRVVQRWCRLDLGPHDFEDDRESGVGQVHRGTIREQRRRGVPLVPRNDRPTHRDGQSAAEPKATPNLSLSTDGIDAEENVSPGQHTVAVRVENQQMYDNLVGHDVHLIRFDDDTDVADVNGWTNWTDPNHSCRTGTNRGRSWAGCRRSTVRNCSMGWNAKMRASTWT
ncbi:hypothetical protein [Halorussus salinisoli]|uniref:hypothetical protein n=1 Tax=Halorussus salinisoli TaxID=2558242 RepID=UPI0010C1E3EA|nr:hypothetical protein [Halorussus salinisoli]